MVDVNIYLYLMHYENIRGQLIPTSLGHLWGSALEDV